jgi:hypothetical protein
MEETAMWGRAWCISLGVISASKTDPEYERDRSGFGLTQLEIPKSALPPKSRSYSAA